MYCGEVNVAQYELNPFLSLAEELQVKGLTHKKSNKGLKRSESSKQLNDIIQDGKRQKIWHPRTQNHGAVNETINGRTERHSGSILPINRAGNDHTHSAQEQRGTPKPQGMPKV